MKNQSLDKRVSFETIVWWWSIAIVAGIIIAAVVLPNYNR